MSSKPKRILFCYTVVREFATQYEVEEAKAFIDDMKHMGATDKAIRDLTHNQIAYWSEEDECGRSNHAVEIIKR